MVYTSTRRRALITGASSGIGLAFARELSGRGYDLILTARREDRLERLAKELRDAHAVDVAVVPADLAQPEAVQLLVATLEARGLRVDFLVNNAGFGVPGRYTSTTWEQQQAFLQVLVVAVAELSHRLLPGMVERRWGRIINVASVAGLLPGVAGHTLYAASKAFVIKFSESLALETAEQGIHVSASCPGFTLTEFHDVTGTRAQVSTMPAYMWLDAARVAHDSYEAVMRGVPVFVPGRLYRTLTGVSRVVPPSLVWAVMKRQARRFRRL